MLFDRELNPMDFYMATAETLSHLNHSRTTGDIERIRDPERSDVYRLVPTA